MVHWPFVVVIVHNVHISLTTVQQSPEIADMARSVDTKAPARRSTRQASAAPPEPTSSKSASKRKRTAKGEADDSDIVLFDEVPRIPPSRQASTSARVSSGRRARAPEPVEELPEDKPSPPKKSKSADSDDDSNEDDDEDFEERGVAVSRKAKPISRVTRKPQSRSTRAKQLEPAKVMEILDSESQYEEEEKPKPKGKKAVKPPSKAAARGKVPVQARGKQKTVQLEDEGGSSTDEVIRIKQERVTSLTAASRTSSAEVEDHVTPRANRTRPTPTVDEETEIAPSASVASALNEDEEDEQERSLLEPTPPPPPQRPLAVPAPIPEVEEPKGPKSRLVIHKMALINFKSYAGRQVIGPFHKVSANAFSHMNICSNIFRSHFLQLSVQMARGNQTPSTLCYLFLVTAHRRCVRESFPSLSIILPIFPILTSVLSKFTFVKSLIWCVSTCPAQWSLADTLI